VTRAADPPMSIPDEITEAVLARDEVARYLQGDGDGKQPSARERVETYLGEMRTTQRHSMYKVLKHPLYPIFRKVDRHVEGIEHVRAATAAGRVVYISNHKSHLDYLLELLALEDCAIRPPVIAAGINLFGGPLGLINRQITGAIPIRRNTKDPVYLATLKAYVAEVLRRHDVFFYIEGGRSYTGEFKAPKTGLVHAALQAGVAGLQIIPVAIAYDLVLEDRSLARQGVKKSQRPFSRELAEMVGSAVGYQTRSFTVFGEPVSVTGFDHHTRRDVLDLAQLVKARISLLHKVVPTAIVAAAMRPSSPPAELRARIAALVDRLRERGANLDITDPHEIMVSGADRLVDRDAMAVDNGLYRVRDRTLLRYYARSIAHLIAPVRQPPIPVS
jgi:1-acyl-sn-glycerol-3-phosphate acyltransferase